MSGSQVTPFPDLDDVLAVLVTRVREALGANLVGVYLQGSFALGDGDLHSDCDFIAVTAGPLSEHEQQGLRALHDELPTQPGYWNRRLEGSYAPQADLGGDGYGRDWFYIDNGWREMQWSTHCNSEVARWILRERGIALIGPEPTNLVAPVPPAAMRQAAARTLVDFIPKNLTWASAYAWERYAVQTLCRVLYSATTAEVVSKQAALQWAASQVDPRWRAMLETVHADRRFGWDRVDPPRPTPDEANGFADYVSAEVTRILEHQK